MARMGGGAEFFCTCDPKNSKIIVSGLLELVIGDHLSVCVTVFVCEYFCVCNCVYVCVGSCVYVCVGDCVYVCVGDYVYVYPDVWCWW